MHRDRRQRMSASGARSDRHEDAGVPTPRIRRLGRAVRCFTRDPQGAAAVESALTITVLIVTLAALMDIVGTVYAKDRMERAAHAAARALALDPDADPCAAVRRELDLSEFFDCATAGWVLMVEPGVSPLTLPVTLDGAVQDADPDAEPGSLVLVRIFWNHDTWSFDALRSGERGTRETVEMISMGLASIE